MRRTVVTLALLASFVLAGCGEAKLSSPDDNNEAVSLARLGVKECKDHGGLMFALSISHSTAEAIICRDQTVVPAHASN